MKVFTSQYKVTLAFKELVIMDEGRECTECSRTEVPKHSVFVVPLVIFLWCS